MCHLCYQPTTIGVGKPTCLVSIGTTRLDLDASCSENGPNLSLDPTPCFLVPIIVKCSKLVIMEAQALLDSKQINMFYGQGTSAMIQVGSSEK